MATLFKLRGVINGETSHAGCECTVWAHQAKMGKDFGLPNLTDLSIHAGRTLGPADLYVVRIKYADGMERRIGVKAIAINNSSELRLVGHRSEWVFDKIGLV